VRGFVAGSVVLIVMYVAFQPGGARAAEQGSNWAVAGLRRLLGSDVAGVPNKAAPVGKEAKRGTK
jgi:hypothetical protein